MAVEFDSLVQTSWLFLVAAGMPDTISGTHLQLRAKPQCMAALSALDIACMLYHLYQQQRALQRRSARGSGRGCVVQLVLVLTHPSCSAGLWQDIPMP